MRIVVTSSGPDLDSPASPVFGRCPVYMFVDTDTMAFEAVENPAVSAPGGAGIQAAQFVVQKGVQAILTGNVGPNAFQVFNASGVQIYLHGGGTVRQVVEAFKAGQLQPVGGANVAAHTGMGGGMGRGMGAGRGMGMSRGGRSALTPSREEEIASLRQTAAELRQQLADIADRLERLAKEDA